MKAKAAIDSVFTASISYTANLRYLPPPIASLRNPPLPTHGPTLPVGDRLRREGVKKSAEVQSTASSVKTAGWSLHAGSCIFLTESQLHFCEFPAKETCVLKMLIFAT